MGGQKGQVALYVLIGLVVLIIIVLALYLVSLKKTETQTSANQQALLQNDPQLAAEIQRMQQRVDDCLGQTAADSLQEYQSSGTPVTTQADAEQMLADDIAAKFPDCFYQFNTEGKLQITDDGAPSVTAMLSDSKLLVTATYATQGTYDGKMYTLKDYTGSAPSNLKPMIDRALSIKQALSGATGATGGTFTPDSSFIDPTDCSVDLYAYEDQGIYADLTVNDDGTMTAYFYDYNDYLQGLTDTPPKPIVFDLPPCTPTAEAP